MTDFEAICELQGGGSLRCPGAGGWGGLCCALCSCVAVGRRARDRSLVRVLRGDSYGKVGRYMYMTGTGVGLYANIQHARYK